MTAPFMNNFRSLSKQFSAIFKSLIFRISFPRKAICRSSGRKPKIFGFKNVLEPERNQKNSHFRKTLDCI